MTPSLTLLAAGSLKSAFIPLLARFQHQTGILVDAHYGPAGLLRERIEAGEACSVFASANSQHPQALHQAGLAGECYLFARNQLMLTVRRRAQTEARDWLALLSDPDLRLAISTPGCDPSGDYAWQLFSLIEQRYPGTGAAIRARARPLVGGRGSLRVPAGETAGTWLIRENLTDLFIGYAHYAAQMTACDELFTLLVPPAWNIRCDYLLAQVDQSAGAQRLCRFILGAEGQLLLKKAGFLAVNDVL
ncbi:substrate-binding domain-containing protein [Klebsiella grimontii]|uniref:substrate-binding domain-containing protein n=1 Tax=Klebsiella grimontii TaxID=2058152 RepID=UPI001CCF6D6E|nr:substrate-binding domain-containing protein [Klebsiella grimontii]MBZ7674525.1 molybdate ABC transporter substrate-binding protein [Klebsiella grimontii]